MVTSCCAYGCTYRYEKGKSIGIFRFPKNKIRREAWVKAVRRENWEPSDGSRICGKHFQTGKPSRDQNHPDYIPNVFIFNSNRNTAFLYERRKKNLEKKSENSNQQQQLAASGPLPLQSVPSDEDEIIAEADDEAGDDMNQDMDQSSLIQSLYLEINALREEKLMLQKKIDEMDPVKSILMDKTKLCFYTGIDIDVFNWLIPVIEKDISKSCNLSLETQLLIVLMKLKLDLLATDIANRFNVSLRTIQRIFDEWIPILALKLKYLIVWPCKRALERKKPECFKNSLFKNTVCILDCTEVQIERASHQFTRSQTWSNYKHAHTIKFLVGMTPRGAVSFLSEVYGGRVSDKEITLESGFLELLGQGDLVLADRGFILEDDFSRIGAKLIVPSFTKGKKQLSKQEVYHSKHVSNVRIHIERVIKQIKRFRILKTQIPIRFLKYIDSVVTICAALSNTTRGIVT